MLTQYYNMVNTGKILCDNSQIKLISLLELYSIKRNKLSLFFSRSKERKRGVYIYGGVGRGKSMIMGLYYNNCNIIKKRKVHFNQFIEELHHKLNRLQMQSVSDPMKLLAYDLAYELDLLCIDEFNISDITDAVIFFRLLSILFTYNINIIITSNYSPNELYKGGLHRELFIATIDSLSKNLNIVNFDGKDDYRMRKINFNSEKYFIGADVRTYLEALFQKLTGGLHLLNIELKNRSRKINVEKSYNDIAWFHFDELCKKPMWKADYLFIANLFSTLFIEAIPSFNFYNQNERKRFTILIDTLYDCGNKLFCSLEKEPHNLYNIEEEIPIEFQRTISRLIEMRSR